MKRITWMRGLVALGLSVLASASRTACQTSSTGASLLTKWPTCSSDRMEARCERRVALWRERARPTGRAAVEAVEEAERRAVLRTAVMAITSFWFCSPR